MLLRIATPGGPAVRFFWGTTPKRLALLLCDRTRTPSPLPRGPGYGAIESPRTLPPERRGLIFISHVPN